MGASTDFSNCSSKGCTALLQGYYKVITRYYNVLQGYYKAFCFVSRFGLSSTMRRAFQKSELEMIILFFF